MAAPLSGTEVLVDFVPTVVRVLSDLIDDAFADLDRFYPGSKRPRRQPTEQRIAEVDLSWDRSPITRTLPNGKEIDMFLIGALSEALRRRVVTLHHWERNGHIPTAPYRWRSGTSQNSKQAGKRLYSRAIIEKTVEIFLDHGVLHSKRIDWPAHQDLSIDLFEQWKAIHYNETTKEQHTTMNQGV